jgi:transposase
MKKDLRSLSREALSVFRISTVKMVSEGWLSQKDAARIQNIDQSILSNWMQVYKQKWLRGLKAQEKNGGRPKDMTKNLTLREMNKLTKYLLSEPRDIEQLAVDSSLWTAAIVAELIRIHFGKVLKEGQIYKVLALLGFTNQKPIFRAYQQNLEKVQEWREVLRPRIENEAKREGREVLYWDEAWFKSTDHKWTTWWIKGKTPIVSATWARFSINAASAISKNGVLRFMSYEGSFTSDTLILFMERIIRNTDQKYTLILDGHPSHKTKKVNQWLKDNYEQIKLYHLPPYSPELNPDEQVWWNVKQQMKGVISISRADIRKKICNCLLRIQKKKELISSFFRHPEFV